MVGTKDTQLQPLSNSDSPLRDYKPVNARYDGQPVYYNPTTDDFASEDRQEGVLVAIPTDVEQQIRGNLDMPRQVKARLLHRPGRFVTVTPSVDWPLRRGVVIETDQIGLTLRVTGLDGPITEPIVEFWPWSEIICLVAAEPTEAERALLAFSTE